MPPTDTQTQLEPTSETTETVHVDVLIVGAGISGIGAAYHLRTHLPETSFLIVDALDGAGGTWWTHRFPGIRSDSDLFTFGYGFKPWRGPSIASAGEILSYLNEVIEENDLAGSIRYRHKVTHASWCSEKQLWTVEVSRGEDDGAPLRITTPFLWMCQGYYGHEKGYTPTWPGMDEFRGEIVHPQQWPEDLDYTGKRIVVIGSGATAATLIPALAEKAEHVTMLQRTPTFFLPRPKTLELAETLRKLDTPEEWTHEIVRRAYFAQGEEIITTARQAPDALREWLLDQMRPHLPEGFEVEKHFNPPYRPWQQRIAVVPEGDMFRAIRDGKASVVTDTIDSFTEDGIRTGSGEQLAADVIVTATGFDLALFGGIEFEVDGEPVDFTRELTHRGIMISNVPNMAYVFGYFRSSWTLRADLVSAYVVRLLQYMKDRDASVVVPRLRPQDADMPRLPFVDEDNVSAGYMMRTRDKMFRQGDREPWVHFKEFHEERESLPVADLDDGLEYG
ncbi:NAD(P)/FAD-dependent oxidoreductase [Blastococcus sp. Marseille-P5729]|uniref:flavin-containing monooxygenase n=1 Tax=Blastococcus sp. Marseille-P5729 TaxID=2086582 RepID=UPI000D10BE5E|nr:NAD(P)/FAD-dependent oxidoreductase [Blastococcus sp. Marseille-P5729]